MQDISKLIEQQAQLAMERDRQIAELEIFKEVARRCRFVKKHLELKAMKTLLKN